MKRAVTDQVLRRIRAKRRAWVFTAKDFVDMGSREAVDTMVEAGAAAGGTADVNPVQDHGFMYGRDILDPDGHVWGPFWMDPAVANGEAPVPEVAA